MEDKRGDNRVLVGELIKSDHLKDPGMDIREVGWVGIAWIALA